MKHEDWRELSSVMSSISSLYSSGGSRPPAFVLTLELLLKLGQVTSCLLSLNGDDPAFSVARVAQAIKTTTAVLESCHHPSEGWGLPPELADSLARQRCEQTSLLQAMAWALRTEARALFFNPRVQQQQRKKQQGPQYVGAAGGSSEEEDDEHAGDGGLHQLWNQVLGMTGKPAADDSSQQQQEQQPATPLLQFWAALGLPGPLLQLASCSDVFTRAADVEYVQACRVARFLLQGASHLQPSSGREPAGNNNNSTTHAAQRRRSSTGGDVVSRTDRAALDLAGDHASTAAARGAFVVRSSKGFSLSPGSPASPASPRTPNSPREDEEEMNDLGRPGHP
ncbi:hypothetical protein OEZ86_014506 [Tetradesmus obliquus]|nr:hypothetical protein OEZ86_014506 [Tetradesmus obliquus]